MLNIWYIINTMKLFVDDLRNVPDESWMLSRTITDAINAIDVFNFEVISLDHDISHSVIMESSSRSYPCKETFLPVAMYINEKYEKRLIGREVGLKFACTSIDCPERQGEECEDGRIPKIIIYTSNPTGALRMQRALNNKYKKGFDITIKESTNF